MKPEYRLKPFLLGMAQAFDLFGFLSRREPNRNPAEEDARALASDWEAVGRDLYSVLPSSSRQVRE